MPKASSSVFDWVNLPEILTMEQVAAALGVSRATVYKLAHQPGFPSMRFGRAFRVQKAALIRWLEDQASDTGSDDRHRS